MMDNIREKLVKLQKEAIREFMGLVSDVPLTDFVADYLIANGVIVQEWIPISNRLPTKKDTYDGDTILAVEKEYGIADPWSLESVLKYPQDFICWTQVPQPPKGDNI